MSLKFSRQALLLSVISLLFSAAAQAHWELNNEGSTLSFVTTKADNVAEVHTFDRLGGSIGDDGSLDISIELASVNTLIPIRNERMQNLLFETGMFPQARVTGKVDIAAIAALPAGDTVIIPVEFTLNLHSRSNPLTAELVVTRQANGLVAATRKPVIVTAEAFGLEAGVEALREIAGLSRISHAVPVSFVVEFQRD